MPDKKLKPSPKKVLSKIKKFISSLEDILKPLNVLFNEDEVRDRLKYLFEDFGWEHLSGGAYAEVFASPCGQYALRVQIDSDHYHHFAEFAMKHPNNPYLPNIHWHKQYDIPDLDHDVIVKSVTLMERLDPLESSDIYTLFTSEVEFIQNIKEFTLFPKCYEIAGFFGEIATGLAELREQFDLEFDLYDTENGFYLSNIMWREDHLVITDPLK